MPLSLRTVSSAHRHPPYQHLEEWSWPSAASSGTLPLPPCLRGKGHESAGIHSGTKASYFTSDSVTMEAKSKRICQGFLVIAESPELRQVHVIMPSLFKLLLVADSVLSTYGPHSLSPFHNSGRYHTVTLILQRKKLTPRTLNYFLKVI